MHSTKAFHFRQVAAVSIVGLLFLFFVPIGVTFGKTPIVSEDEKVSVTGSAAGVKISQVSWKGDQMFDLLQHAPTSYAYHVTASSYSVKSVIKTKAGKKKTVYSAPQVTVRATFPSTKGKWRLYSKTSNKTGWLIVRRAYKIDATGETYTVGLAGPTDFILVDDTALLQTGSFETAKPKEAAVMSQAVIADRPKDGTVIVPAASVKKGAVVDFGIVGAGRLGLVANNANAEKNIEMEFEHFESDGVTAEWRWRVSNGVLPSDSYAVWEPTHPTPGYVVEYAGVDGWKEVQTIASERMVRIPLSSGDMWRYRVHPAQSSAVADLMLVSKKDNMSTAFIAPVGSSVLWNLSKDTTAWSFRCANVTESVSIHIGSTSNFGTWSVWTGLDPAALKQTKELSEGVQDISVPCDASWVSIRETPNVFTGAASWYPTRLSSKAPAGYGAAMNVVPQGSWMTVSLPNSDKRVTVKIVSTGPYADGRLIDLTGTAFGKLASTGVGVLRRVIVRPATQEEIAAVQKLVVTQKNSATKKSFEVKKVVSKAKAE